jgi:hypothetical protein
MVKYIYREVRQQINPVVDALLDSEGRVILETNCNYWRIEFWRILGGYAKFGCLYLDNTAILFSNNRGDIALENWPGSYVSIESPVCSPNIYMNKNMMLSDGNGVTKGTLTQPVPNGNFLERQVSIVMVRGYFEEVK